MRLPRPSSEAARLAAIYGAYFSVTAVQLPFWPVWLQARGMTATEIAVLVGATSLARVSSNPLVAQIADRSGPVLRQRLLPATAVAAAVLVPLFALTTTFWPMLALTLVTAALYTSLLPLTETTTMALAGLKRLDYGSVRLWGSLAFIATITGVGRLIGWIGTDAILTMIILFYGVLVIASLLMPQAPALPKPPAADPAAGGGKLPLRALFVDRGFLSFIVATSFGQGSHAVYYTFATLHWRAIGLSDGVIGGLWATGVSVEVMMFFASRYILRLIGARAMLICGCASGIIRWTALAFVTDPWLTLPFQALHSGTFAMTHVSAMNLMTKRVDARLAARAQALYASISTGLALGLATLAAGPLYAAFGGRAYLFAASMSMTATAAALIMTRFWRGR